MLRIRRIYDDVLPANKAVLQQVCEILRARFTDVDPYEIDTLGDRLRNPFKQRFRPVLFVSDTLRRRVLGFALLLHEPEIGFCYLDWIATAGGKSGGGLGSALYDRVRAEAVALKSKGLFFECLPDDAENCPDESLLKENRARMRFYERYGARPVEGTAYESKIKPEDTCMPHLVYDALDADRPLKRSFARKVVRAILERKYAEYCPRDYVEKVVGSFKDDPVHLRNFRYVKPQAVRADVESRSVEQIALIVNDRHEIHHVHERGYVESPVRIRSIMEELDKSGLFMRIKPRYFADKHLHGVHAVDFINYLRRASENTPENKSLYPYVFPIRNKTRPPKEPTVLAGYYCIDTFTPLNKNAYPAARRAVDCSLTAAREVLDGRRIAYALVRPPGHHAENRVFGGFCYFNNNAVVAQYLSAYGKVAILDIDYHHGNGQQDIFYRRSDVLTVSIHGNPRFAYPYFSGFEDERGEGEGEGFNLNLPLEESINGLQYRQALAKAIQRIEVFDPRFLVVALGLDTAAGDPTGTWSLKLKDFEENGRMIGLLGLPVVVVQEGGYRTRTLGKNVARFFKGLVSSMTEWSEKRRETKPAIHGIRMRYDINSEDPERIRKLIDITGFFSKEESNVAVELVTERLTRGENSGYSFILAEHYGRFVGYTCFGLIPCTSSSFDIYWIAVHPDYQGKGVGHKLLEHTERRIKQAGGTRIYVETSQRIQYAGTRSFYEGCGYRLESVISDFYAPDEGKVIYCKKTA